MVAKVMKIWNDRAVLRQHDWVVTVDAGLPKEAMDPLMELAKDCQNPDYRALGYMLVVNNGDKNCVTGWNVGRASHVGHPSAPATEPSRLTPMCARQHCSLLRVAIGSVPTRDAALA
jgi:hypothetical protein